MTEQDKQALIKHFCSRDCGEAAKDCTIMPCHEIELIQEFPTTEPDTDTISRAKAIDALMNALNDVGVLDAEDINTVFQMLPPAQPKRGRWIGKYPVTSVCSECGFLIHDSKVKAFAYCPNCGAEMRGEQNE